MNPNLNDSFTDYLNRQLDKQTTANQFEQYSTDSKQSGLLFSGVNLTDTETADTPQTWNQYFDKLMPQEENITELFDLTRKVFELGVEPFETHFSPVDSPYLLQAGATLYFCKQFPNHVILFPGSQLVLNPSRATVDTRADYMTIAIQAIEAEFISGYSESHHVHLACGQNQVLIHASHLPEIPTVSGQTYLVHEEHPLRMALIQYAFKMRYRNINTVMSKQDFLAQLTNDQPPSLPRVYQTILLEMFEHRYSELKTSIPKVTTADSDSVVQWLLLRDELQSIYYVVGDHCIDARSKVQRLDELFPSFGFSHILPNHTQLAAAWFADPSCWWGQSAALSQLIDDLK